MSQTNRAVKASALWTLVVEVLVFVNGLIGKLTLTVRERNDKQWDAPNTTTDSIFK